MHSKCILMGFLSGRSLSVAPDTFTYTPLREGGHVFPDHLQMWSNLMSMSGMNKAIEQSQFPSFPWTGSVLRVLTGLSRCYYHATRGCSSTQLLCVNTRCSVSTLTPSLKMGKEKEYVSQTECTPTAIRLSAQTGISMWTSCDAHAAHTVSHDACMHYEHTLVHEHMCPLTQNNTQPEAEDLRLRSGTWSQSHLGPQTLLRFPQSGLIPAAQRAAVLLHVSVSTYNCAAGIHAARFCLVVTD